MQGDGYCHYLHFTTGAEREGETEKLRKLLLSRGAGLHPRQTDFRAHCGSLGYQHIIIFGESEFDLNADMNNEMLNDANSNSLRCSSAKLLTVLHS